MSWFRVADLILFSDVTYDSLGLRLDDYVASVNDRGMGDDAVRHSVRGNMSSVVPVVCDLGRPLFLVISEYECRSGWGR
jgi:hypothetical protein